MTLTGQNSLSSIDRTVLDRVMSSDTVTLSKEISGRVRQSTDSGGGPGILRVAVESGFIGERAHHQDARLSGSLPVSHLRQERKHFQRTKKLCKRLGSSGQGNLRNCPRQSELIGGGSQPRYRRYRTGCEASPIKAKGNQYQVKFLKTDLRILLRRYLQERNRQSSQMRSSCQTGIAGFRSARSRTVSRIG